MAATVPTGARSATAELAGGTPTCHFLPVLFIVLLGPTLINMMEALPCRALSPSPHPADLLRDSYRADRAVMPVIAASVAVVCAAVAAACGRWMRALADSDSRWLRTGLHPTLASAGGFGAAYLSTGWAEVATFSALAVACALLVTIDLAVFRLPDKIVLPMYPVVFGGLALAAATDGQWGTLGRAVAAAAALLAFYFILALINPSGLGLGDVKLSGLLGAFLGWLGWPAVMAGTLATFVLNAVVALVLLAMRRVGVKSAIAFGPAMVTGAVLGAAYFAVRTAGLA